MSRGRPTTVTVTLTAAQRQTLAAWQRAHTCPAGQARRARILLLLADGSPITRVAQTVGISRRFVYQWVRRFQAGGLDGLRGRRPGRRPGPQPQATRGGLSRHALFVRLCGLADGLQAVLDVSDLRQAALLLTQGLEALDGLIDDVVDHAIIESDAPETFRDLGVVPCDDTCS